MKAHGVHRRGGGNMFLLYPKTGPKLDRPAGTSSSSASGSKPNATKNTKTSLDDYSWALDVGGYDKATPQSKLRPFKLNRSELDPENNPWKFETTTKGTNETTVDKKDNLEDKKDNTDLKGKKKMAPFVFFKKSAAAPTGPKPKYADPAKAAIIKTLEDNATYDSLWTLCWEVNLSFMTSASVSRSRCIKCNTALADSEGKFHSGFASTATYANCGHNSRGGFCVCKKCDEDLVFDITTVGVPCFEKGCKEELKVDRTIVSEKLANERSGLLDDYFTLLNAYHTDTFECAICLSEVDRRYQPKGKIAPGCKHAESSCCLECLKSMIDSAVRNAMWGDLKCPELDCQAGLDSAAVKRYASEAAYAKWEKFQLMKALEGDEEFRWCPGENFTCGHGQLHPERDSQPRIICSECDTHHCYTCRVIWHRGETCAEYQANLATSQSEALILKTTKRCPARGCGIPIEKREACLEVSHRGGCGTNFCWDCKAIVGNDIPHSERVANRHFSTCKAMEVRHCDGVVFVDKPPRDGNEKYRDGWAEDPNYERNDRRDGEHMYCRSPTCTRPRCKEVTSGNTPAAATTEITRIALAV
ncbi:hypothetical protein EYR41_002469 [Orbilia oligospora]|uniref:RBR-type E3 ubiquitin transferase n=1 Tax=Orbilia oligospora TaxID=2813651 RepID=A0A7C8K4Z6_ORBOL|nr:hypothetical protein TWF751_002479 [Orbilia oligospora]KAF3260845.1 hypothetical protein TWF217_004704 [Orbilia oligospora]KAF3268141.1 hypothetical protein TWF128_008150 [Orbilia oligospora]KAF3282176.1 hypothetical protein TWF132_010756 [Orbilia oligospora]TGJ62494.1 hypothetical protein EYR41_002469 [Orbilia oligospora]